MLSYVRQDGLALRRAPPELKEDDEVVLVAISQNFESLQYAAPARSSDRQLILRATSQIYKALEQRPGQSAKACGEEAADKYIHALQRFAPSLLEDPKFLLAVNVMDHRGVEALRYAAPAVWEDRNFALAAVAQNGFALERASPAIKKDPGREEH